MKNLLQITKLLFYSLLITAFSAHFAIAQVPTAQEGPSTATNDGTVGNKDWQNPNNVTTNNSQYAFVNITGGTETRYLKATDFGFNIPTSAEIKGIEVKITLHADRANAVEDNSVKLVQNGSVVGDDRARGTATTPVYWPTTPAVVTYGGPSILWNSGNSSLTWTAADINGSDFGVAISATKQPGQSAEARVNYILVIVHFSPRDFYYDGTGSLTDVTNWGINPDGTGSNPVNFLQDSTSFHVVNGSPTLSSNWTVSGTGSRIIIGNGTTPRTLTVASGVNLSGDIVVKNNGRYRSESTIALPNLVDLQTGSSVGYAAIGSTSQTILQANYYNLRVDGSTKHLAGDISVFNEFEFAGSNVKVDLGTFDLRMLAGSDIIGYSSGNYFITSGRGSLERPVDPGGSEDFPIGTADNYNPVTIYVNSSSSGDDFLVRTFNGIYEDYAGDDPNGPALSNNEVNQTWIITERDASQTTLADITLQWNEDEEGANFDRTDAAIGYYNGSSWVSSTRSAANGSDPYTLTVNNVSLFDQTPYGIGDAQSPVPVELIRFTANINPDGGAILNWATASELNNSHFEIQYTYDGHTWETLGEVAGNGTSTKMHEYSYVDVRPVNQNTCYRLKQVDFNGEFDYSNVECVNATIAGEITVYPNPANVHEAVNVNLGSDNEVDASVRIINMQGQVVKHIEVNGASSAQINVDGLASGWYTVHVATPGNTFSERILLTR